MLLLLAGAHYLTAANATVLFWPAFALTRPLGAAGGDALTKPVGAGGLGWGAAWGAAALALVLVASVAFQTRRLRRRAPALLPAPVDRRTAGPSGPTAHLRPRRPPRHDSRTGQTGVAWIAVAVL